MKQLYRFISSLKFCIILLILLTLASLVGVIIPQGLEPQRYISKWGTVGGSLLLSIGLDTLFSTIWYNVLLAVFALNTLLCTANRIRATFHTLTHSKYPSASQIRSLPLHQTIEVNGTLDMITANVSVFFRKRHFSLSQKNDNGEACFLDVRRGLLRELGYALLHLSIIPILAGGLVGKMTGFAYVQKLSADEQAAVRDRPFFIRCEFFELERNERGMIKDYKSGLTIIDSTGDTLATKVIEVNHPLVYRGVKFYQSSYQADPMSVNNMELMINGPLVGQLGKKVVLHSGEQLTIEGTELAVHAGAFMPDFMFDMETRQPRNRSMHHNNPALFVTVTHHDDTLLSRWVFQKFASMHHKDDAYSVSFLSYDQRMSTGLLVKENPGGGIIWVGIVFMCIGVLLVFWVPRRRIWIAIGNAASRNELVIGATLPPGDPEQAEIFESIVTKLSGMLQDKGLTNNTEKEITHAAD